MSDGEPRFDMCPYWNVNCIDCVTKPCLYDLEYEDDNEQGV